MFWVPPGELGMNCQHQIMNLMQLPFAIRHIAVMPDAHAGCGMPIGAILATKNAVVINAVGADIGCGMYAARLVGTPKGDKLYERLPEIRHKIKNQTSICFRSRSMPYADASLPNLSCSTLVESRQSSALHQLGTLGGGNHFIEIQEGPDKSPWIMIHSGSRNLGKVVCDYYNAWAKSTNESNYSQVDPKWDLAFFHRKHEGFREYWNDMSYCVAYAKKNRRLLRRVVVDVFREFWPDTTFTEPIDICHNHAAIENHYDENMIVHRKGAAGPIRKNYGIIPGSMGSASFIVAGKQEAASYCSTSHGAGRKMNRKEAQRFLSLQSQRAKLSGLIAHGLTTRAHLGEAPDAYKDIKEVMERQKDLCTPVVCLSPLASIKG